MISLKLTHCEYTNSMLKPLETSNPFYIHKLNILPATYNIIDNIDIIKLLRQLFLKLNCIPIIKSKSRAFIYFLNVTHFCKTRLSTVKPNNEKLP